MGLELLKRILSSIVILPLSLFFIVKGSFYFIFFILFCLSMSSYEWHKMSKKKFYHIPGLILIILSFLSIYILRIYNNDYHTVLFVITICVSTDIGGYIFGKIFKGPKLTRFSPNKTYAGMAGSFILSIITIKITIIFNANLIGFDQFFLIILISSISQLGDITISYFKRLSKIKDTGKIIPGHGGILDRIDGMIFAFPFALITTVLF